MRRALLLSAALLACTQAGARVRDPDAPDAAAAEPAPQFPRDQVEAYLRDGYLPPDFDQATPFHQRIMFHGAQTMAATPFIQRMAAALKKGDVVVVYGTNPFISQVEGGTGWVHAALVSGVDPVEVIETGAVSPDQSAVREVPIAEFVDATQGVGYRVIHPTEDAALVDRAVAFGRSQLDDPYDYGYGLVPDPDHSYWYCSKLVDAEYRQAARPGASPLRIQKRTRRDRVTAMVRLFVREFRIEDRAAATAWVEEATQSDLLHPGTRTKVSTSRLMEDLVDHLLGESPVLQRLVRDPDGHRFLVRFSTALVQALLDKKLTPDLVRNTLWSEASRMGLLTDDKLIAEGLAGMLSIDWGYVFQEDLRVVEGREDGIVPDFVSPADIADGDNPYRDDFGSTGA